MTSLSIITTTDPLAGQLPNLLHALSSLATEQGKIYEVVIVDDLNQWKTNPAPIESDFLNLKIKAIRPEQHIGQIKAMTLGLLQAKSPVILTIDPDMYPCVPEIPAMQALLNDYTLAVHGVRQSRYDTSLFRLFASAIFNWLVRKLTGLATKDFGSPVTLFQKEVLENLDLYATGGPNIKMYAYMQLGPRLGSYEISNAATPIGASHYRFPQLLLTAVKILKECFYLRRLACKA
ncbi:glycosyltransferase [Alcanivorax jadensis]|mgnify:CR=1 FL=1|uniref:glycosyltransferase n=1 Tax=Alcanivorax jadensis TaxID=64988 RepID=UPI0023540673|nr:glycosyltransferase [Alcanivorax jadensis]|tara:strand:+ start:4509 stop:5210 length:702 start_codon:yes stop_codon:yes gene_type:complete